MREGDDEKIQMMSVFGAFIFLLVANWEIERVLEEPFENRINLQSERFNSPLNVMLLASGVIWIVGGTISSIMGLRFNHSLKRADISLEQLSAEELQIQNGIFVDQITRERKSQSFQEKQSQNHTVQAQTLSFALKLKITIPKFIQLLCLLSAVEYFSYSMVIFCSVLAKIGLGTLYETLASKRQDRLFKFMITIVAFLNFCCFIYFTFSSNTKVTNQQSFYGYLFLAIMIIARLIRKIFQSRLNQQCMNMSSLQQITIQAKYNFIMAYLLAFYFNQQIYGLVFVVIHYEFVVSLLILAITLMFGTFFKNQLTKKYGNDFSEFVVIFQKNITVIINSVYFLNGISWVIISTVSLNVLASFANLILQEKMDHKNQKTSQLSFKTCGKILKQDQIQSQDDNHYPHQETRKING